MYDSTLSLIITIVLVVTLSIMFTFGITGIILVMCGEDIDLPIQLVLIFTFIGGVGITFLMTWYIMRREIMRLHNGLSDAQDRYERNIRSRILVDINSENYKEGYKRAFDEWYTKHYQI